MNSLFVNNPQTKLNLVNPLNAFMFEQFMIRHND